MLSSSLEFRRIDDDSFLPSPPTFTPSRPSNMSLFQDWTRDLTRRVASLAQKPTFPKPKPRAPSSLSALLPSSFTPLQAFHLGRYLSLLSVFSLLQIFILIALPQASFPFPLSTPRTKTSLDRPEWAWVAVLTKDPLATTVWVVLGGGVVAAWWAGEMGKMWEEEEERKKGRGEKEREEEGEEEERVRRIAGSSSKTVEVSSRSSFFPFPSSLPLLKSTTTRLHTLPYSRANPPPPFRITQTFKSSILATLISSLLIHFFILLLGAPLRLSLQTQAETYALSLVLSFLTVFTPVWVLGLPPIWGQEGGKDVKGRWVWTRLFIEVE